MQLVRQRRRQSGCRIAASSLEQLAGAGVSVQVTGADRRHRIDRAAGLCAANLVHSAPHCVDVSAVLATAAQVGQFQLLLRPVAQATLVHFQIAEVPVVASVAAADRFVA